MIAAEGPKLMRAIEKMNRKATELSSR
jgi:hypothetical protein